MSSDLDQADFDAVFENIRLKEPELESNPYRLVEGRNAEHHHYFGGECRLPLDGPQPPTELHLLFDFDLADTRLEFLGFRGIERLPLLFPFRYDGGRLSYSVTAKGIQVHRIEPEDVQPDWPYEGFPDVLEQRSIDLEPISYEEHKTLVFAARYTRHDVEDRHGLLSAADRSLLSQRNFPFPQIGGIQYLPSGIGDATCHNRRCPLPSIGAAIGVPHDPHETMLRVASIGHAPFDGVELWGDYGSDVYIQYFVCPYCQSINTCAVA
jgi:hypothetical protein